MNGHKSPTENTSKRTYDDNYFGNKDTTAEKTTLTMNDGKIPGKIIIFQRMVGCNSFRERNLH